MTDRVPVVVDGIAVRCKDLEASTRFYEELLGFKRTWAAERMVGLTAPVSDGTTVGLMLDEIPASVPGTPGLYGVVIGITVDDVDATVDRLRSAGRGVRHEPAGEPDGGRHASVFDPDGHELWISGARTSE